MENILRELGLSEKERAVFQTIVQLGVATAAQIAALTGVNRTTVYAVGKELVKLGLVAEDLAAKKHTFVRLAPESARGLLLPLQKEIEDKEKKVSTLIEMLQTTMDAAAITLPKVVFIQQAQIENYLYTRTPIWNESIRETKGEYVGFLDFTFTQIYEEWVRWYWAHPSSKDIQLRLLTNESEFEKTVMREKFDERRQIEFWEEAGDITYNTWVNGKYTLLINTRVRPFYLIEIYDENFARSQRQIFEAVWKMK